MITFYYMEESIQDRKKEVAAEAASRQTLRGIMAADYHRRGFFKPAFDEDPGPSPFFAPDERDFYHFIDRDGFFCGQRIVW